jgi:putative ABC transport system permease protein
MNFILQILRVLAVNLRTVPLRLGNSLVIVIGMAGVVAVLASVEAMSVGFRTTIQSDGRADRAIVLVRGATSEYESGMSRNTIEVFLDAAGIKRDAGGDPVVSGEVVMPAPVIRKVTRSDVNVTLRGVGEHYFTLRPELKLVEGRMYRSGLHELLVGASARSQFFGLDVGDAVRLQDGDWTVVGVFSGSEGARDSELVGDAHTVMSAYKLGVYNSFTVLLNGESALQEFKDSLAVHATLFVDVYAEPKYLATTSRPVSRILNAVVIVAGSIMSLGALFGALNSMHSAVVARSVEMATLRALGFDAMAVMLAILIEASLLALTGAVIGVIIAYAAFDGAAISTLGGAIWDSQLVYALTITPSIALYSIGLACMLGLLGGFAPALRAARANVADALRSV